MVTEKAETSQKLATRLYSDAEKDASYEEEHGPEMTEKQEENLLRGIPRKWLENGKRIELKKVASYFGPLSLSIHSQQVRQFQHPGATGAATNVLQFRHASGQKLAGDPDHMNAVLFLSHDAEPHEFPHAEAVPAEALSSADRRKALPPMHGALLKNEQDVHLFERLIFLNQRNAR